MMMRRRQFLQSSLQLGATPILANWLTSIGDAGVAATNFAEQSFNQHSFSQHWRMGFQGVSKNFEPLEMQLEGDWPRHLHGTFYRNGPALYERAGRRYQHWFDGDGMVQAFKIANKKITHQGNFIATEKFLRESDANKFLYSGTGTSFSDAISPRNNNSTNVANTALLKWNGDLLALWEGGSAYALNPETLTTRGEKTWREDLIDLPFSAHPLIDQDGSLWNIGSASFASTPSLIIYHIDKKSKILDVASLNLPQSSYIHSFTHTQDYLIIYLSSCLFEHTTDPNKVNNFVDSFKWQPRVSSKILVLAKSDLTKPLYFETEAGFIFHFGNAWQEGRQIGFSAALYDDADLLLNGMKKLVAGDNNVGIKQARFVEFNLNLRDRQISTSKTDVFMEFPNVDSRSPFRNQSTIGVQRVNDLDPVPMHRLVSASTQKGILDTYDFGEGVVVEEPLLIAKSNKLFDNYVLLSFLNYHRSESGIALFDANHLSAGPIALATMARVVPLGFHGCFVADS